MAYRTVSYHSNNMPGNIDLAKFNIRESKTTPSYALGTRVTVGDRTFRYAHFGVATTQGMLVSTDISAQSSTATTKLGIIAPVSSNTTTDGTAGSRFLQFTLGSMLINQLAGGYFHVAGGTTGTNLGGGYTYRIKGNTATSGPAAGDIRLEFYDKIETTVTSGASVFMIGNLYADLLPHAASGSTDQLVVGVSCAVQAADDYGWVQTWGPGSCQADGTILAGNPVSASGTSTGAGRVDQIGGPGTSVADLQEEPFVGFAMHDATISRMLLVNLQITP